MLFAVTGGTGIAVRGAKWFFAGTQGERASSGRRMVFIVVRIDMVLILGVITKGRINTTDLSAATAESTTGANWFISSEHSVNLRR
jgi:hypothetical protein